MLQGASSGGWHWSDNVHCWALLLSIVRVDIARVGTVRVRTVRMGTVSVGTISVGTIRVGIVRMGTVSTAGYSWAVGCYYLHLFQKAVKFEYFWVGDIISSSEFRILHNWHLAFVE